MKLPYWAREDRTLEELGAEPLDRYGEWAPTAFDVKGKHFRDAPEDYEYLLVAYVFMPSIENPANFAEIEETLAAIDPEFEDHRIETFSHWATAFDIILVRKDTLCESVARRARSYIKDCYLILNEDRLVDEDESEDGEESEDDGEEHTCTRCGEGFTDSSASLDVPGLCDYCGHMTR